MWGSGRKKSEQKKLCQLGKAPSWEHLCSVYPQKDLVVSQSVHTFTVLFTILITMC